MHLRARNIRKGNGREFNGKWGRYWLDWTLLMSYSAQESVNEGTGVVQQPRGKWARVCYEKISSKSFSKDKAGTGQKQMISVSCLKGVGGITNIEGLFWGDKIDDIGESDIWRGFKMWRVGSTIRTRSVHQVWSGRRETIVRERVDVDNVCRGV